LSLLGDKWLALLTPDEAAEFFQSSHGGQALTAFYHDCCRNIARERECADLVYPIRNGSLCFRRTTSRPQATADLVVRFTMLPVPPHTARYLFSILEHPSCS
jgi:hypothetical protein